MKIYAVRKAWRRINEKLSLREKFACRESGMEDSERAKGKLRATANATQIINKKLPELNLRFGFDGRVDIVIFGDGGGWWWCFVDDLWWCSACRFGVGCECFERASFSRRAL